MRVWDIHPGYLSRQNLLGEHAEIHALYSIITNNKKGYCHHPETKRWMDNIDLLIIRHNLLVKELALREFKHHSPLNFLNYSPIGNLENYHWLVDLPSKQFTILQEKYHKRNQRGRIPLPNFGTEFWAHHKYSIMARGYQYYKEIQHFLSNRPVFFITDDDELIFKVLDMMKRPISPLALRNVVLHLWGYFKNQATPIEKDNFFNLYLSSEKIRFLYLLSEKYQKSYLLHSTIFADFLVN